MSKCAFTGYLHLCLGRDFALLNIIDSRTPEPLYNRCRYDVVELNSDARIHGTSQIQKDLQRV